MGAVVIAEVVELNKLLLALVIVELHVIVKIKLEHLVMAERINLLALAMEDVVAILKKDLHRR